MNDTTHFSLKRIVLLIALFTLTACGGGGGGGGGGGPSQTIPIEPTSVVASTLSESGIRVTWVDNSDNEDGFRVERSLDQTVGFTEIAATGPDETMIDDNGLNADTTYYYRLSAFNTAGDSDYSNVASATTDAAATSPPAAPTNLQGSPLSSSTIRLTWTDNATNEANYAVMHADFSGSCGAFSEIALLSPDTQAYIHSSLSPSSSHCYQVESRNGFGTGLSNLVSDVATFSQFTLTVSKSGTGSGTVTAPGINCGSDCNGLVDGGTVVTLSASADKGSLFNGWSGCDATPGTQCTVTMNANRTVTARFENTGL